MRTNDAARFLLAGLLLGVISIFPANAQNNVINAIPIRVYSSETVTPIVNLNPNLVEGREFFEPMGIATDPASGAVYVADTFNHRVLGFANYLAFENGAAASLVLGQSDFISTNAGGPSVGRADAFTYPTGLAVDSSGNLYVADTGNHRVLRFAKPTLSWPGEGARQQPDLVIGQTNLNTVAPNQGGPASASSLNFPSAANVQSTTSPARVGLAFDGSGNLWVTDFGNNRVLRFPAASLGSGASNGPAADLVLGQPDFTTTTAPPTSGLPARQNKNGIRLPFSVAFVPGPGLLCVGDTLGRVLVYQNPSASGQAAARILGVPTQSQANQGVTVARNVISGGTNGVFAADADTVGVVDSANHRILLYPPFGGWGEETPQFSPNAAIVFGQENFTASLPNRGSGIPGSARLNRPLDAVAGSGKIWIVDTFNHRVLRLGLGAGPTVSEAEAVLGQVAMNGGAPNLTEGREVSYPGGIAVDYSTNPPRVYVADTPNNRVLGFRDVRRLRAGEKADLVLGQPDAVATVTNYPSGQIEQPTRKGLLNPLGVAVDAEGRVYVADAGNSRLLRFPKPDFDNPSVSPDADLVLGQANFESKNPSATQSTLNQPNGITLTRAGAIVVSDRVQNRILYFAPPFTSGMSASKVIGQSSFVDEEYGSAGNRLNSPRGLATDGDNRLYVADYNNNRVQIFNDVDTLPALDAAAGSTIVRGFGADSLSRPEDIAWNHETGQFWVTDTTRNRVLRYPDFFSLFLASNDGAANAFVNIISAAGNRPVSVALDGLGYPLVGEARSRISLYFPRLATTNAATFFIGAPSSNGVGHLAPNTIASAFAFNGNFDPTTEIPQAEAQSVPLPTELSDLQVTLNGRPLPLFFVAKGQINFYLPNDVPEVGTVLIEVRRKSTNDVLAGDFFGMTVAAPGLFTKNNQGTGQVAAVNYQGSTPRGENSAANPIPYRQVIALFGTGMGRVPGAPNDGSVTGTALPTPEKPIVGIGSDPGDVEYSGFSPEFVGLWQINVRVPEKTAPSSSVNVGVAYKSMFSTNGIVNATNPQQVRLQTTIAVKQP
ncbi:MAG: hypothetical protein LC114_12270 [Bryobacterales bacterium]|nr:hypothetical protein [Bryobacterales bacterium]